MYLRLCLVALHVFFFFVVKLAPKEEGQRNKQTNQPNKANIPKSPIGCLSELVPTWPAAENIA